MLGTIPERGCRCLPAFLGVFGSYSECCFPTQTLLTLFAAGILPYLWKLTKRKIAHASMCVKRKVFEKNYLKYVSKINKVQPAHSAGDGWAQQDVVQRHILPSSVNV